MSQSKILAAQYTHSCSQGRTRSLDAGPVCFVETGWKFSFVHVLLTSMEVDHVVAGMNSSFVLSGTGKVENPTKKSFKRIEK